MWIRSRIPSKARRDDGGVNCVAAGWSNVGAFTPGQTLSLRLVEVFESGLTLALPDGSAAALTPAFSAAVTSYAAKAPHSAEHVTVAASGTSVLISPEDADPAAAGHQVALAPGANAVTVAVTMGEGAAATTTIYSVNVTRATTDVCDAHSGGARRHRGAGAGRHRLPRPHPRPSRGHHRHPGFAGPAIAALKAGDFKGPDQGDVAILSTTDGLGSACRPASSMTWAPWSYCIVC